MSFGKDKYYWSNVYPTQLSRSFEKDIKKFGRVLKIIKWGLLTLARRQLQADPIRFFEVILAFVPVNVLLRIFRFTPEFGERMIYPLVALFFGTGNQTPYISSAILERVFLDPSMKLFEFDEKSLLASIPTMYGFPNVSYPQWMKITDMLQLHDAYASWKKKCSENGNVDFKLSHEVMEIKERDRNGVTVAWKTPDGKLASGRFDDLILAVGASQSLQCCGTKIRCRCRQQSEAPRQDSFVA